ncbi:MAG TPA: pyruvate-binding protein [Duganella sp.]|uniref:pyruvate-binding protein n=1 Tax=Duganella sp. TaxID=1904440 RepID=UPI002ED0E17F
MSIRNFAAAAVLLGATVSSHAAVTIFSDNFDADKTTNNATKFVHGWTVSNGTVDVDGTGFVHNEMPGNGHYVDLDGSTMRAGVLSNSFTAGAGGVYTLSFDLAGNQRNWGTDTVEVTFGTTHQTYKIGQSEPITTRKLTFMPATSGVYGVSFHNLGGDNRGAFLHQVTISAVPETDTYAMLLAGLACIGLVARRRKRQDPPF